MPTWILADCHAGADPAGDDGLRDLLDRAIAARADLLVLGDLFAAWLGADRFHTPLQRDVIAQLRRLREAGARTTFVIGNRDYFVAEGQLGRAFDVVLREGLLDLGGVPTWVTHGDGIVAEDRAYRAWAALSRSAPVRALAHALPGPWVARTAERLEARLHHTNRAYKTGALPIAALAALGRAAAAKGARRALVGHFHHDRTIDVPCGVPVIVAPAWLDHRRILVVEESGALRSVDPVDSPSQGLTAK